MYIYLMVEWTAAHDDTLELFNAAWQNVLAYRCLEWLFLAGAECL